MGVDHIFNEIIKEAVGRSNVETPDADKIRKIMEELNLRVDSLLNDTEYKEYFGEE